MWTGGCQRSQSESWPSSDNVTIPTKWWNSTQVQRFVSAFYHSMTTILGPFFFFFKYIHHTLVPCLSESFHYCLFFTHTEKACKNNSLMHLLLINKTYNVEHMTMIWMHSSEICSDIKNFLLVEVSSQAVCSNVQYVGSVHFCPCRQKM